MSNCIKTKIDWFTAVFEDCTIEDILVNFPDLASRITGDFTSVWSQHFLVSRGYCSEVCFSIEGASFMVRFDDVYKNLDDKTDAFEAFTTVFRKIRLDMSGKCLDNFRSMGYDVDQLLWQPFELPDTASYHVTRCDFAFDLLDYHDNFYNDTVSALKELGDDWNGTIGVIGSQRPMSFQINYGAASIIRFGSSNSDKQLRIYDKDKQMRLTRKVQSLYQYEKSWIRIELQARREAAHALLYGDNANFLSVFKFIFQNYGIRQGRGMDSGAIKAWTDLFDWEVIPTIIQNANSAIKVSQIDKATDYLKNVALKSLLVYVSHHGLAALTRLIQDEFLRLQGLSDDPYNVRRLSLILASCMMDDLKLPPHMYRQGSLYHITL